MAQSKHITEAEMTIMKVIWKEQTCTASKIVEEVSKTSSWHFRTIKTLLRNLIKKEIVGYNIDKHDSRIYHYYPLINEEDYLRHERQQFVDMYYDGNVGSLVASFLKDARIEKDEIQKLKQVLNDSLKDNKGEKET